MHDMKLLVNPVDILAMCNVSQMLYTQVLIYCDLVHFHTSQYYLYLYDCLAGSGNRQYCLIPSEATQMNMGNTLILIH